jgi:hypothetical protein
MSKAVAAVSDTCGEALSSSSAAWVCSMRALCFSATSFAALGAAPTRKKSARAAFSVSTTGFR